MAEWVNPTRRKEKEAMKKLGFKTRKQLKKWKKGTKRRLKENKQAGVKNV